MLMVIGDYVLLMINKKYYYCSYGSPIPLEVKDFMMNIDDRLILSQ